MAKTVQGTPTGITLSYFAQRNENRDGGSSSGSRGNSTTSSSSSRNNTSSKNSSSGLKVVNNTNKNPGQTKTERGKTYVQGKNGAWFDTTTDVGRRILSEYSGGSSSSGRGSSSGGSGSSTKVLGAYKVNLGEAQREGSRSDSPDGVTPSTGGRRGGLGHTGGAGSASNGYTGLKATDYLKTNYKTGADYGSSGHRGAVGRLKNGMMVGRDYLESNPDSVIYPLDYKRTNYQSTVDDQGNIYNHRGEKWGEGGVWTYDELPDYAKAKQDWNYGVTPGQSAPDSAAYRDAYNWYNSVYGVAGDDTHPLSAGQASGRGSYWLAGGDGYTGRPTYTPLSLEYSAPDGGGYTQAVNSNSSYIPRDSLGKAIPNTGRNTSLMDEYQRALAQAQSQSARAYEQQIEAGLNSIYAQKDPLEQLYQKSAQQAYIDAELAKKRLPDAMAAQGLNGGATESANLAIETQRGNALNDLTQDYNSALSDINLNAENYRATGNMQIAQSAAEYQQMLANALLQMQQQEADRQWQQQMAQYQNQLAMQRDEAQAALNQKYRTAGYSYGAEPDLGGADTGASLQESLLNGNGSGWIYVSGLGRMTPQEVYNAVQRGEIVETSSNGKVSYRRA